MKKILILTVGLILAATSSFAQTNQVLSRNAVGYQKFNVPARGTGFSLARLDFIGLGSAITYSNLLADQLPNGSRLILFDKPSQQYLFFTRSLGNYPVAIRTAVVNTTRGFFLEGQTNIGQTSYPVFFMGEVPDKFTQPTSTVSGLGGVGTPFQIIGYGYPVRTAWSNTTLLAALSNGSQIITFDGSNYQFFVKSLGNFPVALRTNFLNPGQGFFIKTTNQVVTPWVEPKPYTWP